LRVFENARDRSYFEEDRANGQGPPRFFSLRKGRLERSPFREGGAMSSDPSSNWVMRALTEHEAPLLRYAASLVGPVRAPDLVQDTFMRLCGESQSNVEGHVAAWLFRVCRNRAIELVRAERRVSPLEEAGMEPSNDGGPVGAFERKEALTRVGAALSTLSEREREILRLKVDGGLRYKEIAEVTKLSVSNVGFILHAAISKLKAELARAEVPRPQALERTP
jgi:RNA polymerase sigma-70 factor (ECF subfamily)